MAVRADAIDPGFAEGDSTYNAVHVGPNGRVYFAISTHRIDCHARLGCFDPARWKVIFMRSVGESSDEDPALVIPQGKVHVPLADADGRLYLATMHGYYKTPPRGRSAYPGFHIICLDMQSGALTDLARGPAGEGLITGVLDPARGVYFGLTYPSGLLCRYDLRSGSLQISSRPYAEPSVWGRFRWRRAPRVCRSLGLDADGALYGSCRDGTIWRAEPGGNPSVLPGLNVLQGAVPPIDRKGRRESMWRVVRWDGRDGCFYGIHAGTESLFRFDPRRRRIEPLCRLGVEAFHRAGHAPFRSTLGLTAAPPPRRTLYHIAHGPGDPRRGQPNGARRAHLTSYEIDRGAFVEHGPIETGAGERVLFAESLAADPQGNLYTMGWVEVTDPQEWPLYRKLRAEAAPAEHRHDVYRMLLLRIPSSNSHTSRELDAEYSCARAGRRHD